MIRHPLGVRLSSSRTLREDIYLAASLGAKGVVLDARDELHPDRLTDTGRREIRHLLRTTELHLIALHLPTRSPYDHLDQLEDRIRRADLAFSLAYELGTRLVLVNPGGVPPTEEAERRGIFTMAITELAKRADHRGVRLTLETGFDTGEVVNTFLEGIASPALGASIDPGTLLSHGVDPVKSTVALANWVAHAYATDAATGERRTKVFNPRGMGFPPGSLDWEEYLGAMEEIGYRGFLTAFPDPGQMKTQLPALVNRLKQY